MNDKGVCRTAPATPGLLKISCFSLVMFAAQYFLSVTFNCTTVLTISRATNTSKLHFTWFWMQCFRLLLCLVFSLTISGQYFLVNSICDRKKYLVLISLVNGFSQGCHQYFIASLEHPCIRIWSCGSSKNIYVK